MIVNKKNERLCDILTIVIIINQFLFYLYYEYYEYQSSLGAEFKEKRVQN